MDTKVIMFCNNKGGVGKTTCVAAIADILAGVMDRPTLIIDADPQGNLSGRFGLSPEVVSVDNSLDAYLLNELNVISDSYKNTSIPVKYFFNKCKMYGKNSDEEKFYKNLQIVCASSSLERVIANYVANPQESDGIMRDMIRSIKESQQFEYVLIDTQPNLSYFLKQIMMAADYVMVPVEPSEDSFSGAKAIGHVFNNVAKKKRAFKIDDKIDFLGVFFNKWKKGTIAAKKFENGLEQIWGNNPVFKSKIPMNQDVLNASNVFAPVTVLKPNCEAAKALKNLTLEMVEKIHG